MCVVKSLRQSYIQPLPILRWKYPENLLSDPKVCGPSKYLENSPVLEHRHRGICSKPFYKLLCFTCLFLYVHLWKNTSPPTPRRCMFFL